MFATRLLLLVLRRELLFGHGVKRATALSSFVVPTRLLARGLDLLVVFRVPHAFIDEFFRVGLFVGRRHRGCLLPFGTWHRIPTLIFGNTFRRRERWIYFVFPLQFTLGLVQIGIQNVVLRSAIDHRDFLRAFHDHFLGDRPQTFPTITQPAFFKSWFHKKFCLSPSPMPHELLGL